MRKCYLFVAVVAFFAVFTATALGWHADDVSVEAVCEDNTYLVVASIDQSEEWPDAYVISITPSSFAGSTSGEQGVTVVIGWDTGETQTFNERVRLDGECAEQEEEEPPTDVCPNLEGNQESIPEGMIKDGQGNCVVPPVIIVPPVEPPKGCPDGLPANAGKDGEAGNDDCARTPPVVETIPEVITPVVTPPVVTPPVIKPPKPKPPVFKPPKPKAPAVCVQLGISTHMVKADGKRDRLVVKVGSREGAKVSIRGAGVSQSARTNAQGIAVFTFNAQRIGIITIKAQGACNNARVGVVDVEAATLSLTG